MLGKASAATPDYLWAKNMHNCFAFVMFPKVGLSVCEHLVTAVEEAMQDFQEDMAALKHQEELLLSC